MRPCTSPARLLCVRREALRRRLSRAAGFFCDARFALLLPQIAFAGHAYTATTGGAAVAVRDSPCRFVTPQSIGAAPVLNSPLTRALRSSPPRRYNVLLRAVTPTGTGCIPLQTEGAKAVAVWWSKGSCALLPQCENGRDGRRRAAERAELPRVEETSHAHSREPHPALPPSNPCAPHPPPSGNDVSLMQVVLSGGLGYIWQYSGWARRGRFLGYAEVIREVRARIMRARGAERSFFYLLTYAHAPALSKAEGAAQLAAVISPVTARADERGEPCYLEVSNAADVPFFESLGFAKLQGEGFKLFGVPQVAILVREPRKSA